MCRARVNAIIIDKVSQTCSWYWMFNIAAKMKVIKTDNEVAPARLFHRINSGSFQLITASCDLMKSLFTFSSTTTGRNKLPRSITENS